MSSIRWIEKQSALIWRGRIQFVWLQSEQIKFNVFEKLVIYQNKATSESASLNLICCQMCWLFCSKWWCLACDENEKTNEAFIMMTNMIQKTPKVIQIGFALHFVNCHQGYSNRYGNTKFNPNRWIYSFLFFW